ncbi:hypothetical protein AB5J62_21980 [Amycolatopsis sp. cg5]|uniref:hypothetical protein n=1 Tax=Amycolatopsis sp. cg5 TaxID=3238802 RepID=UPI003524ED82
MSNEDPIRPMGRKQRIERHGGSDQVPRGRAARARAREDEFERDASSRKVDAAVFVICPMVSLVFVLVAVVALVRGPDYDDTMSNHLHTVAFAAVLAILPMTFVIDRVRKRRKSNRSGR